MTMKTEIQTQDMPLKWAVIWVSHERIIAKRGHRLPKRAKRLDFRASYQRNTIIIWLQQVRDMEDQ
jgi:hypothetical protein